MIRSPLCSGLREIEEHWSMDDLVAAHLVLDMQDDLDRKKADAEAEEMKRGSAP